MHHACTAEDDNDVNDAAGSDLSRDDAVRSTMVERSNKEKWLDFRPICQVGLRSMAVG